MLLVFFAFLCLKILRTPRSTRTDTLFACTTLFRSYAQRLGVKVEDLVISQPDTGEQALEICDMLVRSNSVDMVVIDSVDAVRARSEEHTSELQSLMRISYAVLFLQKKTKMTVRIIKVN